MANFLKPIIAILSAGAVFSTLRDQTTQLQEPEPAGFTVTRQVSVDIAGNVASSKNVEVAFEEAIPRADHLQATIWLRDEIAKCIDCLHKPNATPNDSYFYSSQIRYLRAQQLPIKRDHNAALTETKAARDAAERWFAKYSGLSFNEFRDAFVLSSLKSAEFSSDRGFGFEK